MRAFLLVKPCHTLCRFAAAAAIVACSLAPAKPVQAQQNSPAENAFFRGYYLQHETGDLKKAVDEYKKSIALDPASATRAAIDAEMADLQEQLVNSDFAQLMPANSLAFLEISKPGSHLEQIAKMIGLTGREFSAGYKRTVLRLDRNVVIPSDFQISPSLLRELKKIRGAAFSVTDINPNGPPKGVLVIHPGESDLVTGIVETGVQLVPSNEKIGGYPTFQVENEIWIVKTKRMIVVSPEKSQLEDCIQRIANPELPSLANVESFQNARKDNRDVAVFAYASPKLLLEKFGDEIRDQEFAIARMVMDFDHMNHVIATLSDTDQGLQLKVNVDFAEDHNSFGYGLIRTVPLSRKALSHIPTDSVAVVGMGLNPKMVMAAQAAGSNQLTGLDIGREIFANIEEVGLFVLPTVISRDKMPDVGLVIASSDIEKSENLWNTLLELPASMKLEEGPRSKTVTIDGVEAKHYSLPGHSDLPDFLIARLNNESLIAGTEAAVRAALDAAKTGKTLSKDSRAKPFWNSTTDMTAKAAFVHVGRALQLSAQMARGNERQEMLEISKVVDELTLTLAIDEAPANFEARLNAVGLPQFEDVIKTMSKFERPRVRQASDRRGRDRAVSVQDTAVEFESRD